MDFANRVTRPVGTEPVGGVQHSGQRKPKVNESSMLGKVLTIVLLFLVTVIAVGVILMMMFGGKKSESSFVQKNKYQAVFLNGGQVYFGKIGAYTNNYLTLSDIYYLRVNQQVQPGQTQSSNDVSLAKLGNELHGPQDRMVINRSEVQFWENLKDDGQVVKAITEYKKNPNAASNSSSNSSSNSTTQSSGNQQQTNTTPTTNSTSTSNSSSNTGTKKQ